MKTIISFTALFSLLAFAEPQPSTPSDGDKYISDSGRPFVWRNNGWETDWPYLKSPPAVDTTSPFAPQGPHVDASAAGAAGVALGDPWYDQNGQIFIRVISLNTETTVFYAEFANTITAATKLRLSSAIDQLKAANLWDDLIEFVPFGSRYNTSTGTTRYAVKGNDIVGIAANPAASRQVIPANVITDIPATSQSPRIAATVVAWSSQLASSPASGQLARIENASFGNGTLFFWYDGGGLKAQTTGDGAQQIDTYSPATQYGSLAPSVFAASIDSAANQARFSIDGGASYVLDYTHTDSNHDFTKLRISDDVDYGGVMVFDRVLTDAELATVNTILRDTIFTMPGSMLIDGDSLVSEFMNPNWVQIAHGNTEADMTRIANIATGGHTTVDILSGLIAGIQGAPADPEGTEGWYLVCGGTNDMDRAWSDDQSADWTPAGVYIRIQQISTAARVEGRKVAVCIPTFRTDTNPAGIGALQNPNLVILGNLIKDGLEAGDIDGVIDFHKHFLTVDPVYWNNTSIISDGVHPYTLVGQSAMANAYLEFLINR